VASVVDPNALPSAAARTILQRHGRSFHFASHVLAPTDADRAARLYAFCRMLDDTADAEADACSALSMIEEMILGTRPAVSGTVSDFLRLVEETAMPIQPVLSLIAGLRFDQGVVAMQTVDELLRYSYQVAGTVGLMMCAVLDCRDDDALPFAVDLGIGMQLSNIARDVGEDARFGRRYLPACWTGSVLPSEIRDSCSTHGPLTDRLVMARDQVVFLAERYYNSAFRGLAFLPFRARVAILISAYVYRQIGYQAQKHGRTSLGERAVVSGVTKIKMATTALSSWLPRREFHRPSHRHDAALHASIQDCFGAHAVRP
jgi:phytoene synthase